MYIAWVIYECDAVDIDFVIGITTLTKNKNPSRRLWESSWLIKAVVPGNLHQHLHIRAYVLAISIMLFSVHYEKTWCFSPPAYASVTRFY